MVCIIYIVLYWTLAIWWRILGSLQEHQEYTTHMLYGLYVC